MQYPMPLWSVWEEVYIYEYHQLSKCIGGRENILLKASTKGRPFFLAYRKATFSSLFIALSTSKDGPPFRGSAREKRDPCQSSK